MPALPISRKRWAESPSLSQAPLSSVLSHNHISKNNLLYYILKHIGNNKYVIQNKKRFCRRKYRIKLPNAYFY